MIIGKHFEFEAAHQLPPDVPEYGKCRRLHGHRYQLIVEVRGGVNDKGWICNFSDIKKLVMDHIIDHVDHSFLNDVLPEGVPTTAENILIWMWKELIDIMPDEIELYRLTLYETSKSFAIVEQGYHEKTVKEK